jgi:hypothetical protein
MILYAITAAWSRTVEVAREGCAGSIVCPCKLVSSVGKKISRQIPVLKGEVVKASRIESEYNTASE